MKKTKLLRFPKVGRVARNSRAAANVPRAINQTEIPDAVADRLMRDVILPSLVEEYLAEQNTRGQIADVCKNEEQLDTGAIMDSDGPEVFA